METQTTSSATDLFKKSEELLKLRNYSSKTIKSYLFYIKDFLLFAKQNKINDRDEAIKWECCQLNDFKYSKKAKNLV